MALTQEPIAIVGSACRFPGGANCPRKLWELLCEPKDVLKGFDSSGVRPNLSAFYSENCEQAGRTDVESKAYILEEDPTLFDAAFFSISPLEAAGMDPQQRILLETVYESLETAGHPLQAISGSPTAVFVGSMTNDYYDIQVRDPETLPRYNATGTNRSILANRISYVFNLKGPSMTVDTACSSSLVCLHLAVQSLRNGECESAIVAGSNIILDPVIFEAESSLHMLSKDSRSRMWDSSANGYARGEGAASLVLKTLSQALRDGDHIESLIRHTAVNSDGRTKGITMPSPSAQTAVIRKTYLDSGLDPVADRPKFFESHGTGTLAGDPVEAQAIRDAFFPDETASSNPKLLVGSIKTVIGHLEGCAGIAGILKASLSIQNRAIAPNMHFKELNPAINPFYGHLEIPTEAAPWPSVNTGPLRASVNSFGFGGTNAHAILESFEPATRSLTSRRIQLDFVGPFPISAHTETSLLAFSKRFLAYIEADPELNLSDLAWSLQSRRSVFPFKKAFSGATRQRLIETIKQHVVDVEGGRALAGLNARLISDPPERPSILGIFTGQGAQWPTMGARLVKSCKIFRETLEACERALNSLPDSPSWSLVGELLAATTDSRIAEAELSQPLCTAVQIGLVKLLDASGIKLGAVVGHSSGEIAAAYAAGIISADDAMRIAYYRGIYARLAQGVQGQPGSMIAVAIPYEAAVAFCGEEPYAGRINAAASNSPSSVTISGDTEAIEAAKLHFDTHKIFARMLRVDTAYHSHHMAPCATPYLEALERCNITVNPPSPDCTWISSVRGDVDLLEGDLQSLRGEYWVQNMAQPVLFSQALRTSLWNGGPFDLALEVGCHPALQGPASQTFHTSLGTSLPYIGLMSRNQDDWKIFSEAVGQIWEHLGPTSIDFDGYRNLFQTVETFVPTLIKGLPSYAWDHEKSHWRESRISRRYRLGEGPPPHQLLGRRVPDDTDTEMRWRNIFRLGDIPWLRGHQFQGQAIFPAAGYVTMALEAAMVFAKGKIIRLIEIQNLKLTRALIVEDNIAGVEIIFSMSKSPDQPLSRDGDVIETVITCQISTDEVAGDPGRTCSGKVLIHLGPSFGDQLPMQPPKSHKLRPVDVDAFYESVTALGLNYQDHFRGLTAAERSLHCARAWGLWPEVDMEFGNVPHPGFLDSGFQSMFIAYGSPTSDQIWAPYLPVEFKRFVFDPNVDYRCPDGPKVEVEAFITYGSAKVLRGDLHFFTHRSDDGGHCGIQVEGMVLNSFTEPKPSNDRLLFTKTVWKSDIFGGYTDDSEELSALVGSAPDDNLCLVEAIDRLALFYFCKVSAEISGEEASGMKRHHQHFLEVIRYRISEIQDGLHPTAKASWLDDTKEDIQALMDKFPGQIDLCLGRAIGENMIDVMRGKTELLQHMIEDNMLDRLYMEGIGFPFINHFISRVISHISHKYPRMNILEIGAGTGGTTRKLLDVIGDTYSSYTYTDISTGFFEKAAEKFSDHRDKINFRILNVENPPVENGYEEHTYDLVVASNVLHATRSLKETLKNTRTLLKPGGYLVLGEVTGNLLRFLLLMGGLPGWWLGVEDGRTTGPGGTLIQWNELLHGTGFSGIDIGALDNRDPASHSCSVIVSQALDDDFRLLRDPFSWTGIDGQSLLMVGGKTLATSKLLTQLQRQLPFGCSNTIVVDSIDDIEGSHVPPGVSVICVAELDKPIFAEEVTPCRLHALQTLFGGAANLLWVTEGRLGGEPLSNMTVGLGRALGEEIPHLNLQFLDVNKKSRLKARVLAEVFLRLLLFAGAGSSTGEILWTTEPELFYDGQSIQIPRVVLDIPANNRINASRRRITQEVDAETSCVELQAGNTSLQLCEKPPLQHQSPKNSTIANTVSIEVHYSISLHQDIFRREVLCLGVVVGTNQKVMAFSESHVSLLHLVPISKVFSILQSDMTIKDMARITVAVARQLIASAVLSSLQSGNSASVVVYGADPGLARVLEKNMKSRGRHFRLLFASNGSHDDLSGQWLKIHPYATAHSIKQLLPKISGQFVDLLGDAGVQARLPQTYAVRSYDVLSVDPAQQLQCAFEYVIADMDLEADGFHVTPARDLAGSSTSLATYPDVISWIGAGQLSLEMKPLDISQLVDSHKTYLMVGMTSELGLSICQYLIVNGARHLVLTSRNPSISEEWLEEMAQYGADIHVCSMDVSDISTVRSVVDMIRATMPPIGGVCNAALLLSDRMFVDMTAGELKIPFQAKVEGTKNLDSCFSEAESALDFFILFSSVGSITGNAGQSNYHAANMFMSGLAAQRRLRGLPASVVHVGMVVDVGYVARAGRHIEDHLRKRFYLPLSELDVHSMFAEAILASDPRSERADIICGMEPSRDAPDAKRKAPWIFNPRFSHMILEEGKAMAQESTGFQDIHIRKRMEDSRSFEEVLELLTARFVSKLESMLQLAPGAAKADSALVDLGCDSLLAVEIRSWFLKEIAIEIPILKILSGDTICELCALVANKFLAERSNNFDAAGRQDTSAKASAKPTSKLEPTSEVLATGANFTTGELTNGSASVISDTDASSGLPRSPSGSEVIITHSFEIGQSPAENQFARREKMTHAQRRLWFLWKYLKDPTTFNITISLKVEGRLRPLRLRDAFQQVLARHESLRSCFFTEQGSGEAMQGVPPTTLASLKIITGSNEDAVENAFLDYKTRSWDLESGNAIGATLVSHSADSHTLIVGYHHIIMDGIGYALFLRDLDHAYRMAPFSPIAMQPSDFAAAELRNMAIGSLSEQVNFWRAEHDPLPDPLPLLPFARVKSRKVCDNWDGNTCAQEMSLELVAMVKSASQSLRITVFQFHLAAIQALLCKLLDLDEICIGVTDGNRADKRLSSTVGFFLNLLPLRLRVDQAVRFSDLAKSTSAKVFAANENSAVPFDTILDAVGAPRSSSHPPLFQVVVNYRTASFVEVPIGECKLVSSLHQDARNPYDLAFNMTQSGSGTCLMELTARDYLYSAQSCRLLSDMYADLLKRLATLPETPISEILNFSSFQASLSRNVTRGPTVDFGWPGTLVEKFDAICRENIDHIATVDFKQRLTYAELDLRSNNIAVALNHQNLTKGTSVALLLEPCNDTIASMLAILRIGCVYVPLDTSLPEPRHAAVLIDAKISAVVCNDETLAEVHRLRSLAPEGFSVISLADVPEDQAPSRLGNLSTAASPAFLLYSSGSTGVPKGIVLHQSGVINYLASKAQRLKLKKEVSLQQSSTGFDMSIAQIFNGLASGGTVVVVPREARGDPVQICKLMRDERVTFTIATPSECLLWLRYGNEFLRGNSSWANACLGGEVVSEQLKEEFRRLGRDDLVITDCYGPTELSCATTFETVALRSPEESLDDFFSVGKPIANTSIFIMNPSGQPVRRGFTGEIYVGGLGVAIGYSGSPQLNQEKFVVNRLVTSEEREPGLTSLYKTGDRGRLLEDGSLIFMGRLDGDSMVKLRGLRIDLDDVANTLIRASGGSLVNACVTVQGECGHEFLVAFVVLERGKGLSIDELNFLVRNLEMPRYMIPSKAIILERLPTSANGKVDRKALASLQISLASDLTNRPDQTPSSSLLEGQLKLLWDEVLGENVDSDPLTRDSDFFMAGGNSHLLVKLKSAIEESQGVSIPLAELYSASSISTMAAVLASELGTNAHQVNINWNTEVVALESALVRANRAAPRNQPRAQDRHVLLTGSTSFLGSAILNALIQDQTVSKVHCIAVPAGARKLLPDSPAVVVYQGSLTSPHLGLTRGEFESLQNRVDVILHAGSNGHCLNNYHSLITPNVHTTVCLVNLATPRQIPFHFLSSNRVTLLSGSTSLPPVSVADYEPSSDGSEGFTCTKWVSERILETAAHTSQLDVHVHRSCALVGDQAPSSDALNALLRFSILLRAVPRMRGLVGFFDFKHVNEVAREIATQVTAPSAGNPESTRKIVFRHHSSGVRVPVDRFREHMQEMHGGVEFEEVDMAEWVRRARGLGIEELIVGYLEAVVARGDEMAFPYLGAEVEF
ncbi:polyketide synthase module [Podospora appendiculata]|uniref:Polyketide synthase module n=1 Tax=Podospora appendiculata TaxID=314037 RepID=A0AAE0XGI0_9PEZI|nr:polyketide synthase module [Podospora appendiculata]